MASTTEFQSNNVKGHLSTPLLPVVYNSLRIHYSPPSKSWSISKIILLLTTTLIATIVLLCSLNTLKAFSLSPKTPIIQINSLSISKFTISNTKLVANWNASFTFYNPNLALEFSLDRIDGIIFYKEDDALSMSSTDGFHLGSREQKNVYMKFGTTGREGDQPIVEYPVLREIKEDKRSGTVRFSMRMTLWATYKTPLVAWTRWVVINPYCLDLNVGVEVGTGNGSLIGGGAKDCLVLMMLMY